MENEHNMSLNLKLLTREDVAELLQVSATTVWRYTRDKDNPLPFLKIGRNVRFRETDVEKFIAGLATQ